MFDGVVQRASSLPRVGAWLLASLLVWLVLVDAHARAAWLGGVIIVAAVVFGLALAPAQRTRVSLLAVLRFLPHFLRLSVSGAIDVAGRAFRGRNAIAPDLIEQRSRLEPGSAAMTMLALVITMIPGTLCVDIDGNRLTLHIIDRRQHSADDISRLEELIARIFRSPLRQEGTR